MRAPDYTWSDLVYYVGFLVGAGSTYLLLERLGIIHPVVRLFLGIPFGVAVGYVAEKLFDSRRG